MALQVGDKAPDFDLMDQDGQAHKLADYKGKRTLFYFYPKDDTPGCTAQACNLRDNIENLKKDGLTVVGVSKDDEKSHKKFASKYNLPFTILADPDTKMIDAYGAWGERSLYGRKFLGTVRSAVLVGADLKVEMVWSKIAPLKTVPEVKKFLEQNPK